MPSISTTTSLITLLLLSLHPLPSSATYTGSLTYFYPGLGACGLTNTDSDPITAISHILYDSGDYCGRKIKVTGPSGASQVVTVVDRCVGCAEWDLDLSPSVFEAVVGDLSIGRAEGTWEFE